MDTTKIIILTTFFVTISSIWWVICGKLISFKSEEEEVKDLHEYKEELIEIIKHSTENYKQLKIHLECALVEVQEEIEKGTNND